MPFPVPTSTTRSTAGRFDDYYGFAALFAQVDYRVVENNRKDILDKHEFVGEQMVRLNRAAEMRNPRTKSAAKMRFSERSHPTSARATGSVRSRTGSRRRANLFFARAQVNRDVAAPHGPRPVDPNDDFRARNPPTNPELLDWLAKDFAGGGFRLKPHRENDHDEPHVPTRGDRSRPHHDERRPPPLARARATARSRAVTRFARTGDRRAGAVSRLPDRHEGEPDSGSAANRSAVRRRGMSARSS